VYEYYGCFFHGCKKCYPSDKRLRNKDTRKLLSMSWDDTMKRERYLKSKGYKVVSKWACEWKEEKENPEVLLRVQSLEIPSPLNPRDAFFGGRTETFKLCCSQSPMGYEDVTSLYPWVNFNMMYPVGHPTVITHDLKPLKDYFGIIKCTVLPPRDLYLPVLPMHCGPTNKLIFPLCSHCATTFQVDTCFHTEKQRAVTGTWFTEEVKLAEEMGYIVLKTHCVWHFEKKSTSLFQDYVKTFYKKKLLSSKLPYKCEKKILEHMQKIQEKEGITIDKIEDFKPNPGLRQLTKLMLNNLWGRYGMRENMTQTKFVSRFEDLLKIMSDETAEITGIRVVSDSVVQVNYKMKCTEYLPMSTDTNIYVAVATTAWARIRLYQELAQLRERAIYCDTDSVIYQRSANKNENLLTGNFLGDMTDELDADDCIIDFVSGGPKNYAYRTQKGKSVVKVKGFTLDAVNASVFSFGNVKKVIIDGVTAQDDDGDVEERYSSHGKKGRVEICPPKNRKLAAKEERNKFLSEHLKKGDWSSAISGRKGISVYNPTRIFRTRNWKILKKPEQKLYSFCFDKRIILSNYDTVPFGYVGNLG
jgi:hypothetical protein